MMPTVYRHRLDIQKYALFDACVNMTFVSKGGSGTQREDHRARLSHAKPTEMSSRIVLNSCLVETTGSVLPSGAIIYKY